MLEQLEHILNVAIAKRLTVAAKREAIKDMRKLKFKHSNSTDLDILNNQIAILEQCMEEVA